MGAAGGWQGRSSPRASQAWGRLGGRWSRSETPPPGPESAVSRTRDGGGSSGSHHRRSLPSGVFGTGPSTLRYLSSFNPQSNSLRWIMLSQFYSSVKFT